MTIGPSTKASTKSKPSNVSPSSGQPASFRYNNPGAQYPSTQAAKFGQIGYGVIGGGHKIARFTSPVNGAACNFELLRRVYVGMTIGAAGKKWTGAHGFGIPGYNSDATLTAAMVDDPKTAIPLLKAIAHRESGKGNNLTEHQWLQAHKMFQLGSADAFLAVEPKPNTPKVPKTKIKGPTGAGMLVRARKHIGEEYRNINVPKDDPNWDGPWDCAEFMSWLVYQEAGFLYGCIDNAQDPGVVEAYTGAWKRDSKKLGKRISVEEAAGTVGAILLRYPPSSGKMGHIAISDGQGGTVEAKGRRYGVVADVVAGRNWDVGVLIPGFSYDDAAPVEVHPPASIYRRGAANMSALVITAIQTALAERGFDPGPIDGEFGPKTEAAVAAYQQAEGLTIDGEVGPETSAALGVDLKGATASVSAEQAPDTAPPAEVQNQPETEPGNDLIIALIALLLGNKKMLVDSKDNLFGGNARKAFLLIMLKAVLSGKPLDIKELLAALLGNKSLITVAGGQTDPNGLAKDDQTLAALISVLGNEDPEQPVEEKKKLPVNNALGEGIGQPLNGKKSALGIIGAIVTAIIGSADKTGTIGQIAETLPALSGATGPLLPIFLGLAAWGFLGKLEKWNK